MKLNIVYRSRGSINVEVDGRLLTIQCEAYLPGGRTPNVVIYSNSISKWDHDPEGSTTIDEETRLEILENLKGALAAKGTTYEVE